MKPNNVQNWRALARLLASGLALAAWLACRIERTTAMDAAPTNRLAATDSPYLLQHASNPVDWWPWGDEAFAEAARLDRPVFLSIGYSTCHWCHVMERESFEDPETALLLNETFVCIKVDREERPDLDQVYMSVCQMMTGSGGWPLTVLLTPERLPFHAGTYFPRSTRGGRIGVRELCARVGELWRDERGQLTGTAEQVRAALVEQAAPPTATASVDAAAPRRGADRLAARFDPDWGGFGQAPKFPTPHNLLLLLGREEREGGGARLAMVRRTLLAMARGGVHDQLGGGFHRYSTDRRWLVPHFEKMLYDQAGLLLALTGCLEADARRLAALPAEAPEAVEIAAADPELRAALQGLVEYVLRDLALPGGGVRSAEDADSEGEEGRFTVWSAAELREVLGAEDAALAIAAWGVAEDGNWHDEASGHGLPTNILHRGAGWTELAAAAGLAPRDWLERLASARERLLAVRSKRVRPLLDDKVLGDWNGCWIAALARAAGSPPAADAATRASWADRARLDAAFLLRELADGDGGRLHRWRQGRAGIAGQLDDHAYLVWGLLELAALSDGARWLEEARALQVRQDELFGSGAGGVYRLSRETDLPVAPVEDSDGAMPCGNSVSLHNLVRLSRLLGEPAFEERAEALAAALSARRPLDDGGRNWALAGLDALRGSTRELVLVGAPGSADLAALQEAAGHETGPFDYRLTLAPGDPLPPALAGLGLVDGRAAAFLCENRSCRAPIVDPAALAKALRDGRPAR